MDAHITTCPACNTRNRVPAVAAGVPQDIADRAHLAETAAQQKHHEPDPAQPGAPRPVGAGVPSMAAGDGGTSSLTAPKAKTRFFGQTELNPDKVALEFKQISDEILSHLRDNPSTRISIHLEIEATEPAGFSEAQVRTVSENAAVLKFEQFGFEEN